MCLVYVQGTIGLSMSRQLHVMFSLYHIWMPCYNDWQNGWNDSSLPLPHFIDVRTERQNMNYIVANVRRKGEGGMGAVGCSFCIWIWHRALLYMRPTSFVADCRPASQLFWAFFLDVGRIICPSFLNWRSGHDSQTLKSFMAAPTLCSKIVHLE